MDESAQLNLAQIASRARLRDDEFYAAIGQLEANKWERLLSPQIPVTNLASRVADNALTPADAPIPDCQTCGACCAFFLGVSLEAANAMPPERYWEVFVANEEGQELLINRFVRRNAEHGACVSLQGNLGESVACSIYEQRPSPCHKFAAGSDKCHALRRLYGFAPPLTPDAVTAAEAKLAEITARVQDKIGFAEISWLPGEARCVIWAHFLHREKQRLHVYDPLQESWLQDDFLGLTLTEAEQLIKLRQIKEQS